MNTPNPFPIPLAGPNETRQRFKLVVFVVLSIHAAVLLVLLMQGCRQEAPAAKSDLAGANPTASVQTSNQSVTATSNAPFPTNIPALAVVASNAPAMLTNVPPLGAATNDTAAGHAVSPSVIEHTIVQGDMLSKLARSYHTTVKAITEANPGLQPTRLQIGQKIRLPVDGHS